MRAAAVGDSVNWGQGLDPRDKYIPRCVDFLREQGLADLDLTRADFHPHSGAIIGLPHHDRFPHYLGPDEVSNPSWYAQFFGEIPSATPTVLGQLRNIRDGDSVDLLFINGGPNDIGITDSAGFSAAFDAAMARIDSVAAERLPELLRTAREICPNAIIVYTGYYPALSPDSDIPFGIRLLSELNGWAPALAFLQIYWLLGELILWREHERLQDQGMAFHRRILARFREQIAAFNAEHSVELGPVLFSPSGLGARNAMWAPGEAVSPLDEDPAPRVTQIREGFCADVSRADLDESELIGTVSNQTICDIAYVAHPNVNGADRYLHELKLRLQQQYHFSLRSHLDGMVAGATSLRAVAKSYPFVLIDRLRGLTDLRWIDLVTVEYRMDGYVGPTRGGITSIAFDFGWGYQDLDYTYGRIASLELPRRRRVDDFKRLGIRFADFGNIQFNIRFDIKVNGYPLPSVFLNHEDFRQRGENRTWERNSLLAG